MISGTRFLLAGLMTAAIGFTAPGSRYHTLPVIQPAYPIEGELPFYPKSAKPREAIEMCFRKDKNSERQEFREEYCGTAVYCLSGAYEKAGESYASPAACLNRRRRPEEQDEE